MSGIKRELDTNFQAKLLPEKKPKTSKQKHEADALEGGGETKEGRVYKRRDHVVCCRGKEKESG
jgi:hypothetical protein